MNKTLKNVLVTLGILTAVFGTLTAVYFYFKKELKKVAFVGILKPEDAFIGSKENYQE